MNFPLSRPFLFGVIVFGLTASELAFAQIQIDGSGIYTQNWDGALPSDGSTLNWTDDSTVPGWYLGQRDAAASPFWDSTVSPDAGASTSNDWFNYGAALGSDRSLGQYNFNNPIRFGKMAVGLENNTGADATFTNIAFTQEQWHDGNTINGGFRVYYQISSGSVDFSEDLTGWTQIGSDVSNPINAGTAGQLDGNLLANQVNFSESLGDLVVADGETIYFAWTAIQGNSRDAMAVDDLVINYTAIPEPSTALLVAAAGLLLAGRRRR